MFPMHKLNDEGFKAVAFFKTEMSAVVEKVLGEMPEGREKSIFTMKIEEAVFFGTKAIASLPKNHFEIIHF